MNNDTQKPPLAVELPPEHHATRSSRISYYLGLFVVLLGLVTALVLFYWTFQPADILVITNNPTPVQVVMVGNDKYAETRISYCKNNDDLGEVGYTYISKSTVIATPSTPAASKHGCKTNVPALIPIPKQAASDSYHIHFTATYKLNPIRTTTVEWDTQNFNLITGQ